MSNQNTGAVALGYRTQFYAANTAGTNLYATAIGYAAGFSNQGCNSIAIGCNAGCNTQATYAIAIGNTAGQSNQGCNSIAIGCNAGQLTQSIYSLALGFQAGCNTQGCNSIAIGFQAGQVSQSNYSIAIGYQAGQSNQGLSSIALGYEAGYCNQGLNSIAVGFNAGSFSQGANSICIGYNAGSNNDGSNGVAIGYNAGAQGQSTNSLAIGTYAGYSNQGQYSIALGYAAGSNNQFVSSIILNANSLPLNATASGFYVNPIRYVTGNCNVASYNTTNNELSYTDSLQVSTIITSSFTTQQAVPARLGNVLTVDQVYGNDSTASIGGLPYLTVNAAVTAAAAGGGIYTIEILPGTYNLSAGITIPTTCSIRGKSTQTTIIQMTGVTSSTTLITMSTQTRIEDVALILSSATASTNLVGVYFPDGTPINCKIRGCTISVSSTATDSSTVYGIFADGTTANPTIQLSSNTLQRTTVNVTSSTTGAVRGCYITGALQMILRDTTIFATGTGSAINVIGVECTNTGAYVSIQTSTVCARPTSNPETVHDIKQPSLPLGSLPVMYLNAVNLVNADTGSNGFGVNTEPNQLIYVLQGQGGGSGDLEVGNYYLLPGRSEPADLIQNPTAGFHSIPFAQRALVFSANISYEGANFSVGSQLFVNIRKTTSRNTQGSIIASAVLSNTQFGPCNLQNFSATFDPTVPNYLQVQVSTTGAASIPSNLSNALYVSLCTF